MKETNENIEALLLKQLHGELTANERQDLEQWLEQGPANREEYAALAHIWEASSRVLNGPVFDTAAAWKKVSDGLPEDTAGTKSIRRYSWIAAACLLVAVAGWWYLGIQSTSRQKTIFAADGNRILTFPDSSTIYLRKGSKLTWSESASSERGPRVTALEGEAFFVVRHNTQRPFRVNTRQATVEDLGTSFAIRQDDTACQVLVTAGAVKCTARNSPAAAIVLAAGERAQLGAGSWTRYGVKDANFLSWKDHVLEFDQTPLDSVLSAIQDLYGVPVTVSADLRGRLDTIRITARFGAREQLKDVLEEIRLTTGLGMERKKDTIIFFQQ